MTVSNFFIIYPTDRGYILMHSVDGIMSTLSIMEFEQFEVSRTICKGNWYENRFYVVFYRLYLWFMFWKLLCLMNSSTERRCCCKYVLCVSATLIKAKLRRSLVSKSWVMARSIHHTSPHSSHVSATWNIATKFIITADRRWHEMGDNLPFSIGKWKLMVFRLLSE